MKLKCNVCIESSITELPDYIEIGKEITCPVCDKLLAYGEEDYYRVKKWIVVDNKYDKEWGGIPVEIMKD